MVTLREIVMIHDLHRQGMSISAIARQTGLDRKTVRRRLGQGLHSPGYGPRRSRPRLIDAYERYLRERIAAHPGLSARRLWREIAELGYAGGYSTLTDFLREARPPARTGFERRFETPPGKQAQADFAQFKVAFEDEPDQVRTTWLFSMVLAHSRWLWGRFCANQNLQTVLRCHIAAFEAIGGVPAEILYDRMKTAVIGEDPQGVVTYNRSLVDLLGHYGAVPRACRPYRAKTKGKVERPFRHIRQDFFLARCFRNLDDLNDQFDHWRIAQANARVHATTTRVVDEAYAEELPHLTALPAIAHGAPLTVERRISHDGMVSVDGNLHGVPDTTRRRVVDVQSHPSQVRIFEDGALIAVHPLLEGRNQRQLDPSHRLLSSTTSPQASHPPVARRPLDFHAAVGQRLADSGDRP